MPRRLVSTSGNSGITSPALFQVSLIWGRPENKKPRRSEVFHYIKARII
ncbi:hypothetical protein CKO_05092 [Citrobacter koseri ATCC BAA-895]|uniref:Uncharacterized protein n=1 Tax=Citrobacter koseri (strain ATCC BAA-895 / CDC 4225-83 / SGSC4696) TaxID=290338 RepID=A8ARM3_CITK8|nr:hypothetical protein CKO_05092 [Citrobacter koseri ATCC BAA-895]